MRTDHWNRVRNGKTEKVPDPFLHLLRVAASFGESSPAQRRGGSHRAGLRSRDQVRPDPGACEAGRAAGRWRGGPMTTTNFEALSIAVQLREQPPGVFHGRESRGCRSRLRAARTRCASTSTPRASRSAGPLLPSRRMAQTPTSFTSRTCPGDLLLTFWAAGAKDPITERPFADCGKIRREFAGQEKLLIISPCVNANIE